MFRPHALFVCKMIRRLHYGFGQRSPEFEASVGVESISSLDGAEARD